MRRSFLSSTVRGVLVRVLKREKNSIFDNWAGGGLKVGGLGLRLVGGPGCG